MAVAWVWDQVRDTFSQNGPSVTVALDAEVATGNHVVVHGLRRPTSSAITAATCSKGDAVTSIDYAGTAFGGWETWAHGIASVYFPTGAPALTTVTLTWGANTDFSYFSVIAVEYVGIASSAWLGPTAKASTAFDDSPDSGLAAVATEDGLVLGAILGTNEVSTFTPGSGYTARTSIAQLNYGMLVIEDRQGVSGMAYRADGALSQPQGWSAIVVNYKGSGGGPPPVDPPGDSHGRWDPNMRAPS